MAEVRVTADSGGAKGAKPERYDQIPPGALAHLARRFGSGNAKYPAVNGRDNWRNGYPWSLSFAAMQRHAWAFWAGEDNDPETGEPHLAAVAWHAFVLLTWLEDPAVSRFDDRPRPFAPADTGEPPWIAKARAYLADGESVEYVASVTGAPARAVNAVRRRMGREAEERAGR